MKNYLESVAIILLITFSTFFAACKGTVENEAESAAQNPKNDQAAARVRQNPFAHFPNLQTEILSNENTLTTSPIGQVDFKNFTFPFPRGWQDSDSKEFTLENGARPISKERVGVMHITTKYGDVTGDGVDEAFVIIKIETGGGGIPQIVYVFSQKDEKAELIWLFRTGDRADGGLKRIFAENGEAVVELYGKDRYILGEVETMRIDGDEEQLCCPTHFTRSHYKWNGSNFSLQGKRETFSTGDNAAEPELNLGETVNKPNKK
ncbi:MAG: hypothetical protein KIS76_18025 [Pyrinomonadaceae bacterium]|nr:hypothetical protein [Pyrinomonadaceae bacterium]